jgi:3-isopropylmalate dehydratase small subunit
MATVLPTETPEFAFADYTEFNAKLRSLQMAAGSVILAGRNFGCGSSREQAVSTLKGHELTIVAWDFARIFLQNAINLGLRVVAAPGVGGTVGDELEITAEAVINRRTGERFPLQQLPRARQAIMDAGGLIPYTRTRLLEQRSKGT